MLNSFTTLSCRFLGFFNVPILQYIQLSDVIKSAIFPLALFSVAIIAGGAMSFLLPKSNSPLIETEEDKTRLKQKFAIYKKYLNRTCFLGFVTSVCILIFNTEAEKWFYAALPLNFFFLYALIFSPLIKERINCIKIEKNLRTVIIYLLFSIFIYSYGVGAILAQTTTIGEETIEINDKKYNLNYIAWAGEYLCLWDYQAKAIIFKHRSEIKSMKIVLGEPSSFYELLFEHTEKKVKPIGGQPTEEKSS